MHKHAKGIQGKLVDGHNYSENFGKALDKTIYRAALPLGLGLISCNFISQVTGNSGIDISGIMGMGFASLALVKPTVDMSVDAIKSGGVSYITKGISAGIMSGGSVALQIYNIAKGFSAGGGAIVDSHGPTIESIHIAIASGVAAVLGYLTVAGFESRTFKEAKRE